MSKSLQLVVAGLALSLFAVPAFAFHLDDHSRIAEQAYVEFARCFPSLKARLGVKALVGADLDEDLDLITKWLRYSHFYHPGKDLQMWRADSSQRILDLQPELLQCRASAVTWTGEQTADLGHAVHHLQDMAVPAHVVPVNHAAWDGFETYVFAGDISSEWTCGEIAAGAEEDLLAVLNRTAEETLLAVRDFRAYAVTGVEHKPQEISGVEFWQEADGAGFGEYGRLGNVFGTLNVNLDGVDYQMSDANYRAFKQQQMKRAVRATLRALAWAFPQSQVTQ